MNKTPARKNMNPRQDDNLQKKKRSKEEMPDHYTWPECGDTCLIKIHKQTT